MDEPPVSVIISVYNRASEIHQCLDALANQTYPDELLEIIVVDDYSTDNLKSVVGKYKKIRYVLNDLEFCLPAARNKGVQNAKGEIIIFLDDDSVIEPDYVRNIVKVFQKHENVGGVTGKHMNVQIQGIKKGFFGRIMNLYARIFGISGFFANLKGVGRVLPTGFLISNFGEVNTFMEVEWLSGCNMSYSRGAIEDSGSFDPGYDGHSYYEDADYSYRVFKKGYKLLATPDAIVEHLVSPASREKLGRIKYYQLVHNNRFFLKNVYEGKKSRYLRHLLAHIALFLPVFVYSLAYRNPSMVLNYLKAEKKVFTRIFTGL
ncbi:MAG: glycosyltransferase [Candidatus Hodarchaeales archaeon]|jgi:GT2 family glycosyltransferase